MIFIDENTTKEDLLNVIYGDLDLVDVFIKRDLDPEHMEASEILPIVQEWIAEGNECES